MLAWESDYALTARKEMMSGMMFVFKCNQLPICKLNKAG